MKHGSNSHPEVHDGKVIIFSAPSGAGKSTIVKHLASSFPQLVFSISATTRPKRGNEQEGKEYYFLTVDEFRREISGDGFLEYEQVYQDVYYGTLRREINRIWGLGQHVLMDVDVNGGLNLKKCFGEKALGIFVRPPSLAVLEERLRKRGTDTEESIKKRLAKAAHEMSFSDRFDMQLLNNDLQSTLVEAVELVCQFIGLPSPDLDGEEG